MLSFNSILLLLSLEADLWLEARTKVSSKALLAWPQDEVSRSNVIFKRVLLKVNECLMCG
jgi:hypothetical protein